MTDEIQPPEPPESTVTPPPQGPQGSEGVAIVGIVLQQMESMKADILRKIDDNARSATRRWNTHEEEHDEHGKVHDDLASAIAELKRQFDEHMRKERDEQLVRDTRMGPLRATWRLFTADKRWVVVFLYMGFQMLDDFMQFLHQIGLLH